MIEKLTHGCQQVLPLDDFKKKLASGKPLKIKLGADPTAPDLHLGHAVVLTKMRHFQDAGHEVIFLIGDFTALIGDPTGKSKTRPPLTPEEIADHAQTYFKQVNKVLDPTKMTICYNSEWLSKLSIADWLKICAKVTVARIIERDDFAKRLAEHTPISLHELMYPVMQGYDSVALTADVELGGTDQTFNLLMGRHLQEQYNQEPQVIMTLPLLLGLDGIHKMSKSLNNYVGLDEAPENAFGKLMSIADTLMWHYYELLLDKKATEITEMQNNIASGHAHPMTLKKEMAQGIVARFWSAEDAAKARQHFEALFQNQDYSQATEVSLPETLSPECWIVDLLKSLNAISGSSDAKRLIEAGAVLIDETPVADFKATVTWKSGMIIKVGKKKIYKIR